MPLPLLHEFPLVVLSKTRSADKRREYQCAEEAKDETRLRKLTVFAGERVALPGAEDFEVFLALVAMSREQGARRSFRSSQYGLLQMLRWSGSSRRKRLAQALQCWRATSFVYEEEIQTADGGSASIKLPKFTLLVPNLSKDETAFGWHELTFNILQQAPWPALDIGKLLSLRRPTSRQLLLYLEGSGRVGEQNLRELGYEHIGISRKSSIAEVKRFVNAAAEDLVQLGYLRLCSERFRKDAKTKSWFVNLERAAPPLALP